MEAPGELRGVWDEFRIEQVLTNLLTNALRYGGGKPVEMMLWERDGTAHITMRDQGIGIAPEDQERIFEQFERTDDSRKHAPGLGLGLYITRKIVGLHGDASRWRAGPAKARCSMSSCRCRLPPRLRRKCGRRRLPTAREAIGRDTGRIQLA